VKGFDPCVPIGERVGSGWQQVRERVAGIGFGHGRIDWFCARERIRDGIEDRIGGGSEGRCADACHQHHGP